MNKKRKSLKRLAGVSTLAALAPMSWTKPIINSVVLPSHAQTSTTPTPTTQTFTIQLSSTTIDLSNSTQSDDSVLATVTTQPPIPGVQLLMITTENDPNPGVGPPLFETTDTAGVAVFQIGVHGGPTSTEVVGFLQPNPPPADLFDLSMAVASTPTIMVIR